MAQVIDYPRRRLLGAAVATVGLTAFANVPGAYAAQRLLTPPQTRGPFYPVTLPLDKDNDLVTVAGHGGIAKGEIVNVVGRVMDQRGRPIHQARIEIWQCDANGRYRHPRDDNSAPLDPNFQGYGQCVTDGDGAYRFRTIKPVPYPGRAPHIHFTISGPGFEPLTTQMYVDGAPENARDILFNSIEDVRLRRSLLVKFVATGQGDGQIGSFDIVLAADGRFGR